MAATDHQQKIDELMSREGDVLQNAVVKALAAYNKDGSAENARNLREAKRHLADFRRETVAKEITPNQFKSRKAAHQYLLDRGYQLPYSTFADACAAGRCVVEGDRKTILLASLVNYIDKHLRESGSGSAVAADLKLKLENQLLQVKLDKYLLENRKDDAAWMLRTEHEEQVAGILGAAQETVRQRFDMGVGQIMHVLGGDQGRLPELVSLLESTIDEAFNDLAGTHEFDVVFRGVREE